ncbi:MAG: DUF4157 domain-containing protein [Hyphomonadaceae bacterium]
MRRAILPVLLALTALASPVGAQTANSSGASSLSPRPAPSVEPSRPTNPAYAQLVKFTHGFMQVQTQYSANVISETLASAMQRSRDNVRGASKPIPDEVLKEMVPFYPAELLKDVRYTIGDTSQAGLAGFAIRNGNAAAVTLIDTIVFKDEKYVGSLALWAHELHHVQQYHDWGLSGFAANYAFGWKEVEAEASARAAAYVAWYRERKAAH